MIQIYQLFVLRVNSRMVFFSLDTQDKRTHRIYDQTKYSFAEFYMCFYNGHTWQMDKHIYSKYSTHVFLEWTHRTNGHTTYLFKVFYPCLFFNGHTGQTVKQHIYSKYSTHFFNGHTGQTVKQHINSKHSIMDTQDKRTNNIYIQRILPMSFLEWTHRTNGQTIY